MQTVLSATLSRLLTLQLGFERFQYIELNLVCYDQCKSFNVRPSICHSMCGAA